jgi:hypothetical protein
VAGSAVTVRSKGQDTKEAARSWHPRRKDTRQDRDVTIVDIDPWGAFFERFWEQAAEGESADERRGGERKPGKGPRTTGTKPDR